jgi:S1-C subfamily serine protease
MRNKVWLWTALYLVVYVLQTFAQTTTVNWSARAPELLNRVVRLEMAYKGDDTSKCSGVVLNKAAGFIATVQHCTDGELVDITVNGRYAQVVRQSKLQELAIVRAELKDEEQITLAKQVPGYADPIAVFAFAWGSKYQHFQGGFVSLPSDHDNWLVGDIRVLPGDSGGAVVNQAGELVGLVSHVRYAGPMSLAYMVPVDKLREFADIYLPGVK